MCPAAEFTRERREAVTGASEKWRRVRCSVLSGGAGVKNPPAMHETQEMRVRSLGREDLLQEAMATHSSILAWEIPWTEEPGRLWSMRWQRVGHTRARRFLHRILHSSPENLEAELAGLRQGLISLVSSAQGRIPQRAPEWPRGRVLGLAYGSAVAILNCS